MSSAPTLVGQPLLEFREVDTYYGELHVLNGETYLHGTDPFALFDELLKRDAKLDPAHANSGGTPSYRIPRVAEVQRISVENSWMRGPTETDWFYCYDPCTAPLAQPR